MTKKEQIHLDLLEEKLRQAEKELRAWKLTEQIEPDIDVPERGHTFGYDCWSYLESHGLCIRSEFAASSPTTHYTTESAKAIQGGKTSYTSGSQGSRRLYSLRSDALKNARYELERRMIFRLVQCDGIIQDALEKEKLNV